MGWFYLLPIAMDIDKQINFQDFDYNSFEYILKCKVTESYCSSIF